MADEIDKLEDLLAEVVAGCNDAVFKKFPELRSVVVAIAAGALRGGAKRKILDLFDSAPVVRNDLETTGLMLAEIIHAGRDAAALQAECIDFVLGLGIGSCRTETAIGEKYGVGRAAVSARCVGLRELFGLPEIHGMKGDAARLAYSERQQGKRTRPPREDWSFKGLLSGVFGKAHAIA